MNWVTSINQHFQQKPYARLLIIFSTISLSVSGIVYACGWSGEYDLNYSSFSPEAFVAEEYSPMFYTEYTAFYEVNDEKAYDFSTEVHLEWKQYFKNEIKESDLKKLLFNTNLNGLDSLSKFLKKSINFPPEALPNLKGIPIKKRNAFLNYLVLAKKAEKYASWDGRGGWSYERTAASIPTGLDQEIEKMLRKSKDPFIKQR